MIDYEKLKLAYEIVCGLGDWYMTTAAGKEYGIRFTLASEKTTYSFFQYDSIDTLLDKLQELTPPKPKYKTDQLVWRLDEEDNPVSFVIMSISQDQHDEFVYHDGLDYASQSYGWCEEQLYPSREALIDAQIDHWTRLKKQEKSTGSEDVSMSSTSGCDEIKCEHEPSNEQCRWTHQEKCKHCGEFYR